MPHWCVAVEWLRIKEWCLSWQALAPNRSVWPHIWVRASLSSENPRAWPRNWGAKACLQGGCEIAATENRRATVARRRQVLYQGVAHAWQ